MSDDLQKKLNAALAMHQAGELDGATALYRSVIAEDPRQPDALHMLGVIARQIGQPELALKLTEAALAVDQNIPFAWHNRALILRELGRLPDALQSVEQAVALKPDYPEAWDMAAQISRDLGDFDRAREYHARALSLRPDDAKLQSHFALFLLAINELPLAYEVMSKALARDGEIIPLTMANILKAAGYPALALPWFERTCALLPQRREICVNHAAALLQTGDYAGGWDLWEQRPDVDTRFSGIPLWNGTPVAHLLLHEDQGLGDAIQFARYIPLVKQRAQRITLCVAPILQKLFATQFPDIEVIADDRPMPQVDARVRLMSLPYVFGTQLNTIPPPLPLPARAGKMFATVTAPRIGLVWGGNPANTNDRKRSIEFSRLAPLIREDGPHFVSLQKGLQKAQAALAEAGIFDAAPLLNDFADTAALIAELDLLITVDTAPAHLAATMGKPVWLMLSFNPHWPWLLGREDNPWYPAMRLFRQKAPGDWSDPIARAAADLRKLFAGDRSVLVPAPYAGAPVTQNPNAIVLG